MAAGKAKNAASAAVGGAKDFLFGSGEEDRGPDAIANGLRPEFEGLNPYALRGHGFDFQQAYVDRVRDSEYRAVLRLGKWDKGGDPTGSPYVMFLKTRLRELVPYYLEQKIKLDKAAGRADAPDAVEAIVGWGGTRRPFVRSLRKDAVVVLFGASEQRAAVQ